MTFRASSDDCIRESPVSPDLEAVSLSSIHFRPSRQTAPFRHSQRLIRGTSAKRYHSGLPPLSTARSEEGKGKYRFQKGTKMKYCQT